MSPASGPSSPVLLIPGVYESWRFLQPIAEHVHGEGHPVHVLDQLGYNTGTIAEMAEIVSGYLQRLDLSDVVVVAHSKGGLIAKHTLRTPAAFERVRRVIALNSPFSGSRYAAAFWWPAVRDFSPNSPLIRGLLADTTVNERISSLYSVFDPHIPESGWLAGAENIVLPTIGHFRPVGSPGTLALMTMLIERSTRAGAS